MLHPTVGGAVTETSLREGSVCTLTMELHCLTSVHSGMARPDGTPNLPSGHPHNLGTASVWALYLGPPSPYLAGARPGPQEVAR